jgi:RNAse (barnase) inhibitor barstar
LEVAAGSERPEVIEIDLSAVTTADELQRLLLDWLGFPGWYGCNWNAFWDAITSLVVVALSLTPAWGETTVETRVT